MMLSPYLVQDHQVALPMLRVILHHYLTLETPSRVCPEVCYHGDSKSPQVVHHHTGIGEPCQFLLCIAD